MALAARVEEEGPNGTRVSVLWWCPGCDSPHSVRIDGGDRPVWTWNGSVDAPTFAPSYLAYTEAEGKRRTLCHCFVTDGRIQFLVDSPHHLAGKTVEMVDWESAGEPTES